MGVREYGAEGVAERPVHEAARELIAEAEVVPGCKPFHLAQRRIEQCAIDDRECRIFWRSVWITLMSDEYLVANRSELAFAR